MKIYTLLLAATSIYAQGTVSLDQGSTAVLTPTLRGPGAPTAVCSSTRNIGIIYVRTDSGASGSSVYVCAKVGPSLFQWEGPFDGAGTGVTDVTASSPLASSGGPTPNLTITSPLPPSNGGTGISNAGTISTGSSSINFGSLGTGLVKNTTGTGALSNGASGDVIGTFTGCSGILYLGADGACHAASGALPASIIDAAAAGVVCNGSTDNTSVMNTLLSAAGGTIIMPRSGICLVGNLNVTADNITLSGQGSMLKMKPGTVGRLILANGFNNLTFINNIFDGGAQPGLSNIIEIDNAANLQFVGNTIQNTGAPGTAIFQHGLELFQTSGFVNGNHVTNISGYCMHINGSTTGMQITNNHLDHCYKNGAVNQSGGPYVKIDHNLIDHVYDWGAGGSLGAAGNAIYFSSTIGGTANNNVILYTEYSGIRSANSNGVNINGGFFYETGDWSVYLQDFQGGNNTVTGTTTYNALGGGINCANGGDNAAFGCHISGNEMHNMSGSSTNAGSLTPTFGNCVVADTFANVTANTCDGAYYGINIDNGEIGQFVQVGTNVSDNVVTDTRLVTLTVTGTSGSVVGSQNGIITDKLYVGSSLSTASVSGVVISCIPISSGVTCNSPTLITVKPIRGLFVAAQSVIDNGPTGNLTATVGTVTTSANYDLTVSSTADFHLFDEVHIGSGATDATGYVGCLGTITNLGCLLGHVMIIGEANAAGLMVPFPASGTLTDITGGGAATITARTAHPAYLHVGIMLPHGEQSTSCSVLADNNKLWGYSTRAYSGVTNAGGVPDGNDTQTIGDGVCITRSQMNGPPPSITSGFGTGVVFNSVPPSDNSFTLNIGTGGTATTGVVTWGTPYTTYAPDCSEGHKLTNAVTRLNSGLTTLTISSTTAWTANDLISVTCLGGK